MHQRREIDNLKHEIESLPEKVELQSKIEAINKNARVVVRDLMELGNQQSSLGHRVREEKRNLERAQKQYVFIDIYIYFYIYIYIYIYHRYLYLSLLSCYLFFFFYILSK